MLPDDRRAIAISVADTGSGIPADLLEHVFEPFFTTKSVGRGTMHGRPRLTELPHYAHAYR